VVVAFAGAAGSHSRAQEFYCEGVDDDGDVEIDEGCARTCARPYLELGPRVVAAAASGATAVSLVRPGTGYAWAYADTRSGTSQVYVQITATSGAADKPEVMISDGIHAASSPQVLLRSPSTFAVVWLDERTGDSDVYFRVLDDSGAPAAGTADTNVSSTNTASLNPWAVWNGNGFAVVWDDVKGSNRDVYFQRLDAIGQPVGQKTRLTAATSLQEQPSIAWDGTQYAVVWTDERDGNREIYGQRVDAAGGLIGSAVRLTAASGTSQKAVIRAIGSDRFAVAWEDARSGTSEVWYAPWQGPTWGAPAGAAASASSGTASSPSLTTTGAEMLLAWRDTRDGGAEVYARRFGYDGTALSGEVRLTNDGVTETSISIAWHGSGFGVGHLDGQPRLVLAACGGSDADQDAYFADDGDCNDASADQSPAVPEACDGIDNDCDTVRDEACVGTCDARNAAEPVDAYTPEIASEYPRVVWGPGGYGLSWQEREIYPGCCLAWAPYFRTLDADGNPVSAAIRLVPPDLGGEQTWIAWNGSEYAVAWENYNRTDFVARIGFLRIDADGNPIGSHREVTKDPTLPFGSRRPVLVWGPNEYALVFTDFDAGGLPRANMFTRLDRQGRPLERPRDVTPSQYSELPHLSFDGTGYGMSYLYLVDPYFRKLDRFGGFASAAYAMRQDAFDEGYNRVAATPWGYGVTFAQDSAPSSNDVGDIFYQRFDGSGSPVGALVKVTGWSRGGLASQEHNLLWIGNEFAAFAYESDHGESMVLFRFDANGAANGSPLTVFSASPALPAGDPSLAWNGSEPFPVWADSEAGGLDHARPRSRRLACCESVPAPSPVSGVAWTDATTLGWSASGASVYDRVRGNLGALRNASGAYTGTAIDCRNDLAATSSAETNVPPLGGSYYYLVRGVGMCASGTYNGPQPPQLGDRDAGLAADPNACP